MGWGRSPGGLLKSLAVSLLCRVGSDFPMSRLAMRIGGCMPWTPLAVVTLLVCYVTLGLMHRARCRKSVTRGAPGRRRQLLAL